MPVKEGTKISLTFLHFSVSCLFVLWLKRRLNLSFLDCSSEEGKQALSSVGLGLDHSGTFPAEDELVAAVSVYYFLE